jgi:hypothetical protein
MSHMVGSKNISIFLTSAFSSSGVQVKSPATSMCLVVSISLTSIGSREWRVDDILTSVAAKSGRDREAMRWIRMKKK